MDNRTRMKVSRSLTALVALVLVLVALGAVSCGTTPLNKSTQEKLDVAFEDNFEASGAPGMMFGVWTPGESWVKSAGKADIESGRALKTTDCFRIASVTKTFTAEVVLQLVDEKKISLDDSVDKYIPGIPDGSKITIRMLLNHTAGLYDVDDDPFMDELIKNPLRKWTPRELLDYAMGHPPVFAPGESMEYSNSRNFYGTLFPQSSLDLAAPRGAPAPAGLFRRPLSTVLSGQ